MPEKSSEGEGPGKARLALPCSQQFLPEEKLTDSYHPRYSLELMAEIPTPKEVGRRLLEWGKGVKRNFPWRQNRDPYVVWIAETMLQQTQVGTVIPYLERWLARFPTVHALAQASLDEVLKLWEGLGYYARARHVHKAAQEIVQRYGGVLPRNREDLLSLPGIGPYTAGAILSLAYGEDAPILDGNARRVLTRVFGVEGDPRKAAVQRELWTLAEDLIIPGRARAINEAIMDLGREICTPTSPACHLCPLADICVAYRTGRTGELPVRPPRKRPPHYTVTAGVVWDDQARILLARRPPEGLLGGLWEFPGGKVEPGETLPECLKRELREELAIEVEVGRPVGVVEHAYSHFRITLHAFHCRLLRGEPQPIGVAEFRWVRLEEIRQYPLSRADIKILELLEAEAALSGPPVSDEQEQTRADDGDQADKLGRR